MGRKEGTKEGKKEGKKEILVGYSYFLHKHQKSQLPKPSETTSLQNRKVRRWRLERECYPVK